MNNFKIGDIVVCTGFDDLPRPTAYGGLNIIEYFVLTRNDKFIIVDFLENGNFYTRSIILNLYDNNSDLNMQFASEEKYWSSLSLIRDNKLKDLGIYDI